MQDRTRLPLFPLAAFAVALSSCGGSGGATATNNPQPLALTSSTSTLSTARVIACVPASTSAQSVNVGPVAGVTATISFGAFDPSVTGCFNVALSTGNDVEAAHARNVASISRATMSDPRPLLTISVGEVFPGSNSLLGSIIVSNMQLTVSANLNFPDGTYTGVVSSSGLTGPKTFSIVAHNGTLTVGSGQTPSGSPFPIYILAHSYDIISIYAPGVVPALPTPSPSASPSPTASASPSPTPAPSPSPVPTGTPVPTPSGIIGKPPAPQYTVIGSYSAAYGGTDCGMCSFTNRDMIENGGGRTSLSISANFFGTITYTWNNPEEALYTRTLNCPPSWSISASYGGGSIAIPASGPRPYQLSALCTIQYQTFPFDAQGTGYSEEITIM